MHLEQKLVEIVKVEDKVVHVLDVAGPGSPEEFRSEVAAVMCKMTPLTGPEMPESLFLVHSIQMCPIDMIKKLL